MPVVATIGVGILRVICLMQWWVPVVSVVSALVQLVRGLLFFGKVVGFHASMILFVAAAVLAVGGWVIWVALLLVPAFPSVCAILGTHRSLIPTIDGLVVLVVVVATISCRSLVSCGPCVEHDSNPFDARAGCFAS